jgi:hypothetical protein
MSEKPVDEKHAMELPEEHTQQVRLRKNVRDKE